MALAGREKLKITEMRIPSKGEIVRTDTAYQGEIVILPSDSVRLNDVLGDQTRLPRKRWREDPLPMLRTTIAPKTAAQRERLLDALTQLADTDPLLRCEVDSITHEIILSFLGRVQLEVVSALLSEKYKLETVVKEPSVIYMERPLKAASHTIHIEVPPNPFWASIRTVCYTTLAWLRCTIREPGFAGILEPEFSKRCQGWYPLRAGAGLVRLERNGL